MLKFKYLTSFPFYYAKLPPPPTRSLPPLQEKNHLLFLINSIEFMLIKASCIFIYLTEDCS